MNLAELINSVKVAEGLSWRELTERARSRGEQPPTGLYYMATRPIEDFPRTRIIHGVAAALGVEPRVVAAAALESLGLTHECELAVAAVEVHSGGQPGERWVVATPADSVTDEELADAATSRKLVLRVQEQR